MQALFIQSNIFTKQPRKGCVNKTVIEHWGALARSIFDLQNLKLLSKTRRLAFEHRYFHKILKKNYKQIRMK